ncbi:hypothetical protein [Methanosphaera sp.]
MFDESINKEWKMNYFKILATKQDDVAELKEADKLKIEHFPPVIGKYYSNKIDEEQLKKICNGKLKLSKSKLSTDYQENIVKIDYEKAIKTQLNSLMEQQIAKLEQEDPNFLQADEKEEIENSNFPFIKLMTLVYSKDTNEMTPEDQEQWKTYMNQFITQQIGFVVVNTYFTINLYQNNMYTTTFQTPYNKEEVWSKYTDNHNAICVVYDFKEITPTTVTQLQKIFPVLYTKQALTQNDIEYPVYNSHCASLIKIVETINEYDNEWTYITNHKYTETEYRMLDGLLEPVYTNTMNHSKIQEILSDNYLEIKDSQLSYNYEKLIIKLSEVLESEELHKIIDDKFNEVLEITPETMDVDFIKPEAIYLGNKLSKEDEDYYKTIIENENVKIFKIKEKDGRLFKALI